ncbi:Gustatory receptor for bitter taste 66a [Pseudolycoriella hygida]|uniref:Gustatory receptor n=1 Tax=Pseudolycoriella hygida TaxID=35572 RepID=A0A9Q0N096_9DIPT|nr:Gustatory receptor for bitter taste 66a [Pseudolycoriella hygida]
MQNTEGESRQTGKLTFLISMVIMYMEPILMVSDNIAFLVNQRKILDLFDRMEKVNSKLIRENIIVNLSRVRRNTIILVVGITILEIGLVIYNFVFFQDAIWFIPIWLSTLAKVLYVSLVFVTKEFFQGLNQTLLTTQIFFNENKLLKKERLKNVIETDELSYLRREILVKQKIVARPKISPSVGLEKVVNVIPYGENDKKLFHNEKPFSIDSKEIFISDKMDNKIMKLCEIHDDISDIAKRINQMFSVQMLLLIMYGFMALTARIYFMYCSIVGQIIPVVFRAAESTTVSFIYLIYTSAKCLTVVMVSYSTKQVAQRTGIYLHKVAIAVDEDHLYETVNHLSLKLLNHSIRFCACGFFDLDMSTLYAITGGITSYIIILIQFNLAALRVKKSNEAP